MRDKTQHQIKGAFQPRTPKERKAYQEFGKGKTDIVACPQCNCLYYEKSWHHDLDYYEQLNEEKRLKFEICPACRMIKDKQFEGKVVLENISPKIKNEVLRLIKNVGERAYRRDPLDRIINIREKDGRVEVLTTENQLAISIGKQVRRAFKGDLDIKCSHKEDLVRVEVRLQYEID